MANTVEDSTTTMLYSPDRVLREMLASVGFPISVLICRVQIAIEGGEGGEFYSDNPLVIQALQKSRSVIVIAQLSMTSMFGFVVFACFCFEMRFEPGHTLQRNECKITTHTFTKTPTDLC